MNLMFICCWTVKLKYIVYSKSWFTEILLKLNIRILVQIFFLYVIIVNVFKCLLACIPMENVAIL